MAIRSGDFQQAFGDFSDLFAQAEKKNTTIDEKAVPLLMGVTAYCAAAPVGTWPGGNARERAMNTWAVMLQEKQGQVLLQEDIWKWIKRWFPDPVQGERIPIQIADWMGKLEI